MVIILERRRPFKRGWGGEAQPLQQENAEVLKLKHNMSFLKVTKPNMTFMTLILSTDNIP